MPSSFSPSCVEALIRYIWNGQTCENTLWFQTLSETPPTAANLAQLAGTLHTWYQNELRPIQVSNCQLTEIYVRQAVQAGGLEFTTPAAPGDVGSAAGLSEAGNVTLVVSLRTGLSGRSFRGRNYSIGMSQNHQNSGTATSTYVDALEAAYDALFGDIAADGVFQWVVYSQFSGVDENGDPIVRETPLVTPITAAIVVDDRTDSQRRRLRARGA